MELCFCLGQQVHSFSMLSCPDDDDNNNTNNNNKSNNNDNKNKYFNNNINNITKKIKRFPEILFHLIYKSVIASVKCRAIITGNYMIIVNIEKPANVVYA